MDSIDISLEAYFIPTHVADESVDSCDDTRVTENYGACKRVLYCHVEPESSV